MKPKWPKITWTCSDPGSADGPRVLGLNPWIHDFAAHNLWSRPAGLLAVLHTLRAAGAAVALMDCLDRTWSDVPWPRPHPTGKGPYPKTPLPKPAALAGVPRQFSRYGHEPSVVRQALQTLDPKPDLVLVTTAMTYWYPGAAEAIALARDLWPDTPVLLGGIYATLCPEHARGLGADLVLEGRFETQESWAAIWSLLQTPAPELPPCAGLELALDLYLDPDFSIILGSRGCPFRCPYCASRNLYPGFRQAAPDRLLRAVGQEYDRGVRDFAFYDDALLLRPETWLWPLTDWLADKDARLHTPNAMHARYLTPEACQRLKRAGAHMIRLGLETGDFGHRLDEKLTRAEWATALAALREAGFGSEKVGGYILFGLPDQDWDQLEQTIVAARSQGVRPELAYFTPIPSSPLFERACQVSPWPLATEPLCQNNSIWPCVPGGYSVSQVRRWHDILHRT